jgi:hypothetical protein
MRISPLPITYFYKTPLIDLYDVIITYCVFCGVDCFGGFGALPTLGFKLFSVSFTGKG